VAVSHVAYRASLHRRHNAWDDTNLSMRTRKEELVWRSKWRRPEAFFARLERWHPDYNTSVPVLRSNSERGIGAKLSSETTPGCGFPNRMQYRGSAMRLSNSKSFIFPAPGTVEDILVYRTRRSSTLDLYLIEVDVEAQVLDLIEKPSQWPLLHRTSADTGSRKQLVDNTNDFCFRERQASTFFAQAPSILGRFVLEDVENPLPV
jgi:hypothetical protein